MSDEEFLILSKDIGENGQIDPIIIFDGFILDGWHRFQACAELNLEPKTKEFTGDDPAAFVLSKNLHRRHLTASQRAVAVATCREWRLNGGRISVGKIAHSNSNESMAREANVSPRTIKDAKTAIKSGRADDVISGKISVSKAADMARGKEFKPEKKQEPEMDESQPDLAAEFMALNKENEKLQKLNESLLKDDSKREIMTWKSKFDAMCGRLDQVNSTCAEMKKQLEYQTKLLASIRSELGVQKNSEILAALKSK